VEDDHRLASVDGMTAALQADDLYRFFHAGEDETLALRGVSLQVDAGELVAVTGPSGSGKSTLLACLAGLDEPDGGRVHIGGELISRRPEEERAVVRARRIGLLFQQENLVGHLTVAQNLAVARALAGSKRTRAAAEDVLTRVGIASRAGQLPRQLSPSRSQTTPTSSSPTSRPGSSTTPPPRGSSAFCASAPSRAPPCSS
jgi:putative ABC transport system ATP-binding protein